MSNPLDLKKLLEEFNEIPDNPIHIESSKNKNNSNEPKGSKTEKFKPLIETSSSWASQYLSPNVYQMRHPKDEDDNSINSQRTPSRPEKKTTKETTPDWKIAPIDSPEPEKPQLNPLPDNVEFDGEFDDHEKSGILSISSSAWKPVFKKELLANKKELLSGFKNQDDASINSMIIVRDSQNKEYSIPYTLIGKLFNRSKQVTLNINDTSTPYIVLTPKNKDDSEAIRYTNDIALVKFNDKDKIHIMKLNMDIYNSIFSANKHEDKPISTPSIPKPTLQMVDEDEVKPIPKLKPITSKSLVSEEELVKLREKKVKINPVNKEAIKTNKPIPSKTNKPIGKPKLRMVDEMPEPQELAGKNIIVRTKETGNKDIKVRVNSYDPTTDKFNINYNGGNWRGIPTDFIKNGFIRMAAK